MSALQTSSLLDIRYFKNLDILSGLDEKYITYFIENASIKRFEKGKLLFLEGDTVTSFYIVRSGWIKLFRSTEDGEESITSLCKEGDLFSKSALVDGATHYSCAQVVEEAIIYVIPVRILREAIKKDLKLAMGMISYLSQGLNLLSKRVEHLSVMKADQRVGCFFLHLCINSKGSSAKLKLPCNKELIATYLGMKPETFSRSLPKLKAVGVSGDSNYMEINNINALRKHTCISCSSAGDCPACPTYSESNDNMQKKYSASYF